MLKKAIELVENGKKVIVDATYLKANQRKDFYEACIARAFNPFFVHCFAREAVLKDRIRKDGSGRGCFRRGYQYP